MIAMDIGLIAFASFLMAVLMCFDMLTKRNRKSHFGKLLILSTIFGLITFGFIYMINYLLMQIILRGW